MSSAPDLSGVRIAFAAGNAELNRTALTRFAQDTAESGLPLLVVAEFQPEPDGCTWIPFHVQRSKAENRAAIEAALDGRPIGTAALFVSRGTALGDMRLIAVQVAGSRLRVYDSPGDAISAAQIPVWLAGMAAGELQRQFSEGGRGRKWLRRMAHPQEAEIPVRARVAQLRGKLAAKRTGKRRDFPPPLPAADNSLRGVSVVVPSRDGRDLLATMLEALLPQMGEGEVIVVDNGSCDGTRAWLTEAHPEVRVIESATPLSFARAVNLGIRAARFDRVLMLNNDMVPEPGFVTALEEAFERVPGLFCATAQIFFPPGIRREETGKAVLRSEGPLDFPVRCDEPLPGEDLTWVVYGSGGCSLFDASKLRELGGVSETYDPAYVEDLDFGYRGWKRGWPTVFVAGARVEHRHRATTSRFYSPEDLDYFVERNYLRFVETAIGSPGLFRQLWSEGIRRLQLMAMAGSGAALRALRNIPDIGLRPTGPRGLLSEPEIIALGNGDIAAFPGREPRVRARKIVIASPYLPYPLSHGGAVRIFNLMRESARRDDLVLLAFTDQLAPPPAELLAICTEVVLVRRHGSHFRMQSDRPDVIEEFESATFRAALKQAVWRWNATLVQLEFTWMAQYAGRYGRAKTILVEHDITYDLQRQLLENTPLTGQARWELQQQFEKWERFERAAWRSVDCVITMSEKDRAAIGESGRAVTIPNGVDCERFQNRGGEHDPRRLLFIGSFAHRPNVLGLGWFLGEVWPLLSGYTLHVIAGHRTPGSTQIDLDYPGIEVEGFVADVRPAYEQAGIVLAPLVASAGTNIKVLEAMAMERIVVGTPAGFHGLPVRPGVDCRLANSGAEMAAAIREGLDRTMELSARQTASRFDWRAIGEIQRMNYDRLDEQTT